MLTTKAELRQQLKELNRPAPEEDQAIISQLQQLQQIKEADRIFAFVPLKSEVQIQPILDRYPIALPVCDQNGNMVFRAIEGDWKQQVAKKHLGIYEPTNGPIFEPTSKSVILVPGLAFTKDGKRLGRGGGYYDRYLEAHPVFSIGLCHSWQLLQDIPTEEHDQKVDLVITPTLLQ